MKLRCVIPQFQFSFSFAQSGPTRALPPCAPLSAARSFAPSIKRTAIETARIPALLKPVRKTPRALRTQSGLLRQIRKTASHSVAHLNSYLSRFSIAALARAIRDGFGPHDMLHINLQDSAILLQEAGHNREKYPLQRVALRIQRDDLAQHDAHLTQLASRVADVAPYIDEVQIDAVSETGRTSGMAVHLRLYAAIQEELKKRGIGARPFAFA